MIPKFFEVVSFSVIVILNAFSKLNINFIKPIESTTNKMSKCEEILLLSYHFQLPNIKFKYVFTTVKLLRNFRSIYKLNDVTYIEKHFEMSYSCHAYDREVK